MNVVFRNNWLSVFIGLLALTAISSSGVLTKASAEEPWIELLGKDLSKFRGKTGKWFYTSEVTLDPKDDKALLGNPGEGAVLVNAVGKKRNDVNLFTKEKFGDVDLHCEFFIPKGSNAGLKFHEWYEIQIFDSFGKKDLTGADCGGIYPRSELKPRYHHIDKGVAPLVNACSAPGTWQTLDVEFHSPRFDEQGNKSANAKIVKATLNGKVIHQDLELKTPTGSNWSKKEVKQGALMIQGDHGPVAIRNLKLRKITNK